ncbi:MAG TPA: DUF6029 family protein [Bacteroidales bacterium]|nr:DUF6029 family protein [Bacteroidales bacterium]
MKKTAIVLSFLFALIIPSFIFSQGIPDNAKVTGNVQIDAQYYTEDTKLGITDSTLNYRKFGMNSFANLLYTAGNFTAGMRMEAFLNPMLGFDQRYEGVGIPYWFAGYKTGTFQLTAGHFYEQFGSGLILRSWENWMLGYDNSIYGLNAKFSPVSGITLKGLVGVQRYFWQPYEEGNRGIVKGFDGEFDLNQIFPALTDASTRISLGGSFVSKYEKVPTLSYVIDSAYLIDSINWNQQSTYEMNLPYNVGSWAARANLSNGGFNFYAEYAEKANDPNATNNYIFRKGSALYSSLSYSTKGLGIFLSTKWIDNMSYKSKLTESGNPPMLDINYLPAISKEHTYSLASLYPYATQPNGEFGFQGQIDYKLPKETLIGGKYGTLLTVNYSLAKSIEKDTLPDSPITGSLAGTQGYETSFLSVGDLTYYRDLSVLADRKINNKWKLLLGYYNQRYNKNVIEDNIYNEDHIVKTNIAVLDLTYKITRKNSLRMELQGLWSKEDKGDWGALLVEYNVSPKWFFSLQDEYNYGNPAQEMQIHYFNMAFGYTQNTTRFSVRYGRQREGLVCIGGVCRYVPASTGLTLTITSSF